MGEANHRCVTYVWRNDSQTRIMREDVNSRAKGVRTRVIRPRTSINHIQFYNRAAEPRRYM